MGLFRDYQYITVTSCFTHTASTTGGCYVATYVLENSCTRLETIVYIPHVNHYHFRVFKL